LLTSYSTTHFAKSLFAGNWLGTPGAHFISSACRFRSPQAINSAELLGIEAFHQKIRESRT
jgi:hypothetical protein